MIGTILINKIKSIFVNKQYEYKQFKVRNIISLILTCYQDTIVINRIKFVFTSD